MYEGNFDEIKKQNPIVNVFFEIFDSLKKMPGWTKVNRHKLQVESIQLEAEDRFNTSETFSKIVQLPIKDVKEISIITQYERNEQTVMVNFGNFSGKSDIKKFDLMPFNTEYNQDLKSGIGFFSQVVIQEATAPSFTKLKSFIKDVEEINEEYLNIFK